MGKAISFNVSREEMETIGKIVSRALALELGGDRLSLDIDITAAHANGCPLDLDKLLAFGEFDFCHDIAGIIRHIDRKTGKLGGCFLPRCAK